MKDFLIFLPELSEKSFEWDYEANHQECKFYGWALNEVLKAYLKQGQTELNLQEAQAFAKRIISQIGLAEDHF